MSFLDNSGDIILDAVLTDTGRKRMAAGNFSISKFGLGAPPLAHRRLPRKAQTCSVKLRREKKRKEKREKSKEKREKRKEKRKSTNIKVKPLASCLRSLKRVNLALCMETETPTAAKY